MNPRKSCQNCRGGVSCRTCGSRLQPAPDLLSGQDYRLMLLLIDGSDRKYAPKTLEAVVAAYGVSATSARSTLHRLRLKLRRLLAETERHGPRTAPGPASKPQTLSSREEIMRQFKAGGLTPDEAERLLNAAARKQGRRPIRSFMKHWWSSRSWKRSRH